ncbi:MAG: (2Fe-2S)-binding protein [Fimbriimonadaceae bacterium]|nr:(2Fe-2S)-binding protein [Fimbriimonadaceae bacterium]
MASYKINVNGSSVNVEALPDMPLLWVLRDIVGLTGTKYGCGVGSCAACTVLVDGEEKKSCLLPIAEVGAKKITTIEGLSKDGSHPLQRAFIEHDVPQCGYCQAGQIMAAAALLKRKPKPTDADIDDAMSPNVCRCGTYQRIREAIKAAAGITK